MKINLKKWLGLEASYIPLVIGTIVLFVTIYIVYSQSQVILKERLRQRIESMVSIAALQLDPQDVQNIIQNESTLSELVAEVSSGSTEHFDLEEINQKIQQQPLLKNSPIIKVTNQMKQIRDIAPNIRYIYIWRKTSEPNTLAFVTDSDTVYPVDWDKNGKIDDIEIPPLPGEDYDISETPTVGTEAFDHPLVLEDFWTDKWGTFLSGFAPIKDASGNTVAILGMDVEIGDFYTVVRGMLLPFSMQGIVIFILLFTLTLTVMRIWRSRVNLLVETDEAKNATINVVAHQMGTVSTRFKWYAEMLRDGDTSKEECAEQVESGNAELRNIASMFLDAAHVYSKKFTVSPAPLDLNAFFKRLSDAASIGASQKKIQYTASVPSVLPTVLLDESRTYFSIENLLSNAIKYTPEGGKVDFKVTNKSGLLHIAVKDTGVGIPKEDQDKMFKQMYRASNVRNIDGNGLGLYIAKEAIELQGGKVWYESEGVPGKGTTFFVELPLKSAPAQKAEKKK